MKKLTSLLIGCSLALAGAALAQQPVEQQSPSKGKQPREKKAPAAEAKPGPDAAKPQERPAKQPGAMKEPGATKERGAPTEPRAGKGRKAPESEESATAPSAERDVSRQPEDAQSPGAKQQAEQRRKEQAEQRKKGVKEPASAPKTEAPPAADTAGAAPPVSAADQQKARAKGAGAAKKPDPQKVQQIKSQHANFRAQPKPQQVQPVTFNQNRRIERSETWQGPQYEVFRSYRPEWHDAGWYHSRYPNVTLIAGGYYFFNNGYWYPAWGYNPSAQYYAYDGPIYVGQRAVPPDQVIADVQALLQQMGYYRGEVDGLLGPLTREALTAYQADNGLTTTAVIDQPTLDSLGLA
jgi:Putative peptidoglycan binding domain